MTGPFGRPPEDQPRPSEEEIKQTRMEHEEWVQEKEQELAESDVEFIHHFERKTLAGDDGRPVDVEILNETWHVSELTSALVARLADCDGFTDFGNTYYYTNNLNIDLEEKLEEDGVQVADDYESSEKYDYEQLSPEILAQII